MGRYLISPREPFIDVDSRSFETIPRVYILKSFVSSSSTCRLEWRQGVNGGLVEVMGSASHRGIYNLWEVAARKKVYIVCINPVSMDNKRRLPRVRRGNGCTHGDLRVHCCMSELFGSTSLIFIFKVNLVGPRMIADSLSTPLKAWVCMLEAS